MSILNVGNIIFLQLLLEVVLFVLLLFIWRRTSRMSSQAASPQMPEELTASMENFLVEAEKISQTFTDNLQERKELSADLILKLDRRLAEYQTLLKMTEASLAAAQKKAAEIKKITSSAPAAPASTKPSSEIKANPAAPEVRALVLQLAKKGCPPEEIASRAKLRLGEVELIIDLERQFNL